MMTSTTPLPHLGMTLILLLLYSLLTPLQAGPLETPSHEPLPLPEFLPAPGKPPFALPPLPSPRPMAPGTGPTFVLQAIELQGNTVFSDAELKAVAAPFLQQSVSLADLEEIRHRLTLFYIERSYISSGARIKPDQRIVDGVVIYEIIEGQLTHIDTTGLKRLRSDYVTDRLWPDADRPFNTEHLQEYFQLLLQNPLIERMDGRIRPGTAPGETRLEVDVTRAPPYELRAGLHNHSSPNLGAETLTLGTTVRNLSGRGDAVDLGLAYSEGVRDWHSGVALPLNRHDTLLSLRYNANDNQIITPALKNLNIRSEFNSLEIGLQHPLYHTLQRSLSLGISLRKAESQSFILRDVPFAFAEEAIEGKTAATVLRLTQSFQHRGTHQVVALRSTFSFGLDWLDPTRHDDGRADGRFNAWLGQAQYAHLLSESLGQLVLTTDLQLADDRLLGMEKFSIGGVGSVRGYRKNRHLGDSGLRLSSEWRLPIWSGAAFGLNEVSQLHLVPFIDYATAWDRPHHDREQRAGNHPLLATGAGLVWRSQRTEAELFYGYAIESTERREDYNLQDDGIHLRFGVRYP